MKKQFDTPAQAAEDDDEDEGCTVEEVKDEEPAQAAPAKTAQNPVDDTNAFADMIKQAQKEEEPEFVSNLEELD